MRLLQHLLNEVHVYCRLRDMGMPKCTARPCAAAFGRATRIVIYPSGAFTKHWALLQVLIWTAVLVILSACCPIYFTVPDAPTTGSLLGPNRPNSGNLIERWRLER